MAEPIRETVVRKLRTMDARLQNDHARINTIYILIKQFTIPRRRSMSHGPENTTQTHKHNQIKRKQTTQFSFVLLSFRFCILFSAETRAYSAFFLISNFYCIADAIRRAFFILFFAFLQPLRISLNANSRKITQKMNHCSDEDENSIESTHTLTNETLNDDGSDGSKGGRRKQTGAQNSNEALSEHLSSSPLSSSGDAKGGSTSSSLAKDDDTLRKSVARVSVSGPCTPLDTPVPMRRKRALIRSRGNQSGEKVASEDARENCVQRKQSTSSGSGVEDSREESKTPDASKAKKKRNTLIGVREISTEFERDTDSSIASTSKRRSFVKRRLDALRNLSVSNATITNVSISRRPINGRAANFFRSN